MNITVADTLTDIVKSDFRAAAALSYYGLDFCCKGGRSLRDACTAKGVHPEEVLDRIVQEQRSNPHADNFDQWSLAQLVRHIEQQHHAYIRSTAPAISQHLNKVARVHGGRHVETVRIAHLFDKLHADLESHMEKEEHILFPYIYSLGDGIQQHNRPFVSVAAPIRNMIAEHATAGDDMEEIRALSSQYTAPEDACTTYRIAYMELAAFEQDLHTHVHLENNILFPRALALEQELRQPIPEHNNHSSPVNPMSSHI